DVVDPGAPRNVERAERGRSDDGLEAAQLVEWDEGDLFLARGGIAHASLRIAHFRLRHAQAQVSRASEADVDARLLAQGLREGLVEVAAQPGEGGERVTAGSLGNREDAGRRARRLGARLTALDYRHAQAGTRQLVCAAGADRAGTDDDGVGSVQRIRGP